MLQLIKEFRALWQCKYFGEKGQDLIEYALLLAIFSNAGSVTSSAAAVAKRATTK